MSRSCNNYSMTDLLIAILFLFLAVQFGDWIEFRVS
jgi:hypothetical protein